MSSQAERRAGDVAARRCHHPAAPARRLATMTGNVAQVFLTDEAWAAARFGARGGAADPAATSCSRTGTQARGWRSTSAGADVWRRGQTLGVGRELGRAHRGGLPLVSFRWTYRFSARAKRSCRTPRCASVSEPEVEASLDRAGFRLVEVRDAPDRPGLEHVFVAERLTAEGQPFGSTTSGSGWRNSAAAFSLQSLRRSAGGMWPHACSITAWVSGQVLSPWG